ncbi:hypothetical protein ACFL04_03475 [Patescibacteria group bacterium]
MSDLAASSLTIWDPFITLWQILTNGGWLVILGAFLVGFWWWYVIHIKLSYSGKIDYVLLAIDVPKDNEQSPKAVEHIFSQLHGILKSGDLIQRYVAGYNQMGFAFELVSIDGYIQYLVRTPTNYRDLVESAIYAQYPDAEISEATDYTENIPHEYPDDEYDMYGFEMKLTNKQVYPIRTYPEFEHSLSQEFKDPMAALLEMMSRLQVGEQVWLQLNVYPASDKIWREEGKALIKKLVGAKSANGKSGMVSQVGQGVSESITASLMPIGADSDNKVENRWPTLMQHLTPSERSIVEAIGIKLSKLGFFCKIRLIYLGKKNVYNTRTRIQAIMGTIKQFNSQDLNGFKQDKKTRTRAVYPPIKSIIDWRIKRRRKKIMLGYKYRSILRGRNQFVLNIEELASIWHFPVLTVKAPLVQKTESKKSEPPTSLPLEGAQIPIGPEEEVEEAKTAVPTEEKTPANLPFVE